MSTVGNNCCPPVQNCGVTTCCTTGFGFGANRYAFILVLFILLVIIGCAFY